MHPYDNFSISGNYLNRFKQRLRSELTRFEPDSIEATFIKALLRYISFEGHHQYRSGFSAPTLYKEIFPDVHRSLDPAPLSEEYRSLDNLKDRIIRICRDMVESMIKDHLKNDLNRGQGGTPAPER